MFGGGGVGGGFVGGGLFLGLGFCFWGVFFFFGGVCFGGGGFGVGGGCCLWVQFSASTGRGEILRHQRSGSAGKKTAPSAPEGKAVRGTLALIELGRGVVGNHMTREKEGSLTRKSPLLGEGGIVENARKEMRDVANRLRCENERSKRIWDKKEKRSTTVKEGGSA